MNYTLHQLRIFCKVAELRSVTQAAIALHLTQPAVSIQLRKLQEQFGQPLTEVVGRQLYITDFGKEIAEMASSVVSSFDEIKYRTQAYSGKLTGRLKISVVSTGKYVMPYLLSDFLGLHPGIDLEMDVTNRTKVIKDLEQNRVDFALVSVLPNQPSVGALPIMPNPLYLVSNPLLRPATDAYEALQQGPLIYREDGSATRRQMENFIRDKAITARKTLTLTSNEAVKQAVLAGMGYSIMPRIGIRKELLSNELSIIPMDGLPMQTHWNLVWLHGKSFHPISQAYYDFLEANRHELVVKFWGNEQEIIEEVQLDGE